MSSWPKLNRMLQHPFSPFSQPGMMCKLCDEDGGFEHTEDSPTIADHGELKADEPTDIVGADEDDVTKPGQPLPEPRTPSRAEVAIHDLRHLP